jgi:Mce-associated membrane protein
VTNPEDEKTTDVDDAVDESDAVDEAAAPEVLDDAAVAEEAPRRSRVDWGRVAAYGLLPALALILALAAGFLKYVDNSVRESATARAESMQAASAGAIALLSYTPDKVEQQLNDARSLLTGDFLDSYTSLINQVVIPGAKQQQISAVATVPKVGSISADPNQAVALVFVNQAVTVGADAPTSTTSSVRVTLEKTGDKWLISEFAPV